MSSRKPLIQNKTSNKGRRSCMPQMSHFLPPPRQSKNTIFVISQIFLVKSKLSIVVQNPFAFTNFYKQIFFLHFFTWNDNCQQPYSNERLFFYEFQNNFRYFSREIKMVNNQTVQNHFVFTNFSKQKKSCIFLVKSKLSTAKHYKIALFSRIFHQFLQFQVFPNAKLYQVLISYLHDCLGEKSEKNFTLTKKRKKIWRNLTILQNLYQWLPKRIKNPWPKWSWCVKVWLVYQEQVYLDFLGEFCVLLWI